jgi:Ca2+/H+ antiporter, TMEM165/GDT1 family
VNLAIAMTVFALVFPAELPDKTALASLVLGARYRPAYVFAGVAAAFAVSAVLAVAAGSLLGLLPSRPLHALVGVGFLAGAVILLSRRSATTERVDLPDAGRSSAMRVAATSFGVITVAEFGDITQILTANLAAKYHSPVEVVLGAVLALWAVAALAVLGGRALLRVIPVTLLSRLAGAVMAALGILSIIAAITG